MRMDEVARCAMRWYMLVDGVARCSRRWHMLMDRSTCVNIKTIN